MSFKGSKWKKGKATEEEKRESKKYRRGYYRERDRAEKAKGEVVGGARKDGDEIKIVCSPKQLVFVQDMTKFTALSGGVGSSKTWAGAIKSLKLCGEYPGIVGIVTAPSYKVLADSTFPAYENIFPRSIYSFNKTDFKMTIKNGCTILFRSTDDPLLLEGITAGFFHMDEGAKSPRRGFEIMRDRLRQPDMPCIGYVTTTPLGLNWLYTEFLVQQRDNYKLYYISTRDNPFLPKGYLESIIEGYKGQDELALQQIEGRFVVLSGKCFFSIETLKEMINSCREPLETRQGCIKIYKRPMVGRRYVGGADVAEGFGGDKSVLAILDWHAGDLVAAISSNNIATDNFAMLTFELGREYNKALLGIEDNGPGLAMLSKMRDLRYPRLYQRDGVRYGWHTDAKTRPIMLAEIEEAIRHQAITVYDREALDEFFSFVHKDKGSIKAAEGSHDDWVIALAIAWQMRKSFLSTAAYSGKAVDFK